jgi:hypothetical protein
MKERKKKILLKTASNLSSCVHIVRIWKIDWLAWYGAGNLFRVFERVLVRWRMKTEDFSNNGKNKEHPAKPKESSQQKKQNFSFSILYLFPCVCVCVCIRRFSQTAWGHLGQPGGGIYPAIQRVRVWSGSAPAEQEEEKKG